MSSINTMLIIDIVIVVFGIYLLFLAVRMKKNQRVEQFIIAEELLKKCNEEKLLASYLSVRLMIFSIIMIICGALMIVHETVFSMGYGYYFVVLVLAVSFLVFYKQLTDARIKYC